MRLQEHENTVKNAIDKAAKELDAPDWNEFLATIGEFLGLMIGHLSSLPNHSTMTAKIAIANARFKQLILMRGLPGSGKSFLAKALYDSVITAGRTCIIHSTDNFHLEWKNGAMIYVFKPEKLRQFHKSNLDHTVSSMEMGIEVVIVDNTNTTFKEMEPYIKAAIKHGYRVETLEPITSWKFDVEECSKKNSHGVPAEAIQRMLDRWESNSSILSKKEQLESVRNKHKKEIGIEVVS